jgi:hypothetical protein
MRYVAVGLCVFAVACGATPTAPTSSSTSIGGSSVAADVTGGSAVTQAPSDSDLPFKGDVQATEDQRARSGHGTWPQRPRNGASRSK